MAAPSASARVVRPDEAGKALSDLLDLRHCLVLGVARGNKRWQFHQLGAYRAEPGDTIVHITGESGDPTGEEAAAGFANPT